MRIVSLLPSATEIVFALGLGDELVGVTQDCDFPPDARHLPVVTRASTTSRRRPRATSTGASRRRCTPRALYELDDAALAAAKPDLILTQELCRVCAVGYRR